jgi:hypothetical protein
MGRIRALVAVLALGMIGTAPVPTTATSDSRDASTWQRQNEVRLRKMHLVRPDLIPYPTYQEYYA